MQSVVEPASVAEVLPEMIYGNDSDFAWKTVVDFTENVILGLFDTALEFGLGHINGYPWGKR
jgi:hypothetical protein